LDRTYLDTDIQSVRGMVRAALEPAHAKRNIPGADALLRGITQHDATATVAILSGSPLQLRPVLEEKLALDGVRFDTFVLKDNLGNLRRGRFKALRGQLGYKLPHLLADRLTRPAQAQEYLFGDDAEVDALVYALYASILDGDVDEAALGEIMGAGGAYEDQIAHARRSLRALRAARPAPGAVRRIFIHVDRGLPLARFALLGREINVVFSWFQAALALWEDGRLSADGVVAVARRCEEGPPHGPRTLVALVQDAVRRGLVGRTAIDELLRPRSGLGWMAKAASTALDRLGPMGHAERAARAGAPHVAWSAFLQAVAERDEAARA
jgi:hypothetical protein